MKQSARAAFAVVLPAVVTALGVSYLTWKGTIRAMANTATEMEVMNGVARGEAWDRVESLLIRGCNEEALELVRTEQSLELSSISSQAGSNTALKARLEERNPKIAKRAGSVDSGRKYTIPTCE